MNRPSALIVLTRPGNVAIGALAVVVGALTGPAAVEAWGPLLWAVAAAALITAGGNVLNDVADVEVDRLNKPHRPLPSGAVSRRSASAWAIVLFAGGLAAALPLPAACRLIALFAVAGVTLYDLWAKGRPLFGNFLVAFISGLAFLFGSLAVGRGAWGLIPAGLAFLFHFPREIIKDLEDMQADRSAGLNTFPLRAGEGAARRTAQVVLLFLFAALFAPRAWGWLGWGYMAIAAVGVGGPVLFVIVRLSSASDAPAYGRMARLLKWDMLVGLAAILAG